MICRLTLTLSQQLFTYIITRINFIEIMMISYLYKTNTLSLIFMVLAHWNNSPRINLSPPSDTFAWFWVNQSLLFLLNAACLAEKHQMQILQSLAWPDRDWNPWSTTLEANTLCLNSFNIIYSIFTPITFIKSFSEFISNFSHKRWKEYSINLTSDLFLSWCWSISLEMLSEYYSLINKTCKSISVKCQSCINIIPKIK